MIILAYDLATTTGVAVGDTGGAPHCFTEKLDRTPKQHAGRFADALHMAKRHISEYHPDLIAIEKPIAAGPVGSEDRLRVSMGLRGCVLGMARIYHVDIMEFTVASIRKHFLGKGNIKRKAAKRSTIERCRQLGWEVSNDDEADAAAVWERARAEMKLSALPVAGGLGI